MERALHEPEAQNGSLFLFLLFTDDAIWKYQQASPTRHLSNQDAPAKPRHSYRANACRCCKLPIQYRITKSRYALVCWNISALIWPIRDNGFTVRYRSKHYECRASHLNTSLRWSHCNKLGNSFLNAEEICWLKFPYKIHQPCFELTKLDFRRCETYCKS